MGKYAVIFLDFQVCYSLELCRVPAYMKQMITGTSWDDMLDSFKEMVSLLYEIWREYLWDFLDPVEQEIFQTILSKEASDATLRLSLELLSKFLAKRSGRKVIVLIDEYEALNNRAYEFNFFQQVHSSYPFRLYSRLTILIQANEFFSRGVLLALLKVAKIYIICWWNVKHTYPDERTSCICTSSWCNTNCETRMVFWLEQYSGKWRDAGVAQYHPTVTQIHALHTTYSVFAGMLMFTESEVLELRRLKEVSIPSPVD